MLAAPIAHLEAIDRGRANALLGAWGHRMGAFTRPAFEFEAHHALFHNGREVALACSGTTAREVVGQTGLRRTDVVELARLCSERPELNRVMLRLWRELLYPAIADANHRWAAVSYQDAVMHDGGIYRFDGWTMLGDAGGGGTDQRSGRVGRKLKVWAWSHHPSERERIRAAAALGRPLTPPRIQRMPKVWPDVSP